MRFLNLAFNLLNRHLVQYVGEVAPEAVGVLSSHFDVAKVLQQKYHIQSGQLSIVAHERILHFNEHAGLL